MSSRFNEEDARLSIGALSKATGIPSDTLRTWERRYGFPQPDRTPGGHRIYNPEVIDELMLIRDALQQGYRPRQVMTVGEDALRGMLGKPKRSSDEPLHDFSSPLSNLTPQLTRLNHEFGGPAEQVGEWIEMGRRQDVQGLEQSLQRCWFMCGSMMFLQHYMARLVVEVGESWARGELTVGEEHFISERVRDFLTAQWRPMSARARGSTIVCANLPGERHTLGLHMATTVLALHGCCIIFLGADVPIKELIGMSHRGHARALCLSLSITGDPVEQLKAMELVRIELDAHIHMVIGGGGAQRLRGKASKGIEIMQTLLDLEQWLVTTRL